LEEFPEGTAMDAWTAAHLVEPEPEDSATGEPERSGDDDVDVRVGDAGAEPADEAEELR
jgi:hypothetical protein